MITIRSKNLLTTGGNTVGAAITLDGAIIDTILLSSSHYPDNVVPPSSKAAYFNDWGGDIFDGFGYFCIYDTTSQTYFFPQFNLNTTSDTIFFSFQGATYRIVYGNRVTGYYTFHITQTSRNRTFRFCCWGNIGFENHGTVANNSSSITVSGLSSGSISKTYYYYYTRDTGTTDEVFQIGLIPYDVGVTSKPYTTVLATNDNLSFYSAALTEGMTVYLRKGPDTTYPWVSYDLKFSTLDVFTVADKQYADIDDTITYTTSLINAGVTVTSLIFKNTIPSGLSFVTDSLVYNGVTQTGVNTTTGLTIASLAVTTATITFKVKVTTIPSVNPIQNTSSGSFYFAYSTTTNNDTFVSDAFLTQINHVFLNSILTTNKNYSYVGDTITYTLVLNNTGSTTANNAVLSNTIPSGSSFVTNSLTVNNIIQTNENPGLGFNLGTIPIGTTTISFAFLVSTIPSLNAINNSATVTYSYSVDPSIPNAVSQSINTSIATTTINHVFLNSSKTVNKNYSYVGDILNYNVVLSNTGNTTANNVSILDTIPTGSSFITNSLSVNSITQTGGNPNSGFNIGTIPVGITTISFSTTVSTIPTPNKISNAAKISYAFTADPSVPNGVSNNINTNIVTTTINHVFLSSTKTVNKNYSYVGDSLTYTFILKNTGNTTANNVLVLDTLPTEASFTNNSLTLNNVVQTGVNPSSAVNIGTVPIGTTTLSFNVSVSTIPSLNRISNIANFSYLFTTDPSIPNGVSNNINSNIVTTTINHVFLNCSKDSNKKYASLGDKISYTVILNNSGNSTANNVVILDTIPTGTSFVTNSLTINNVTQNGGNPNSGFTIGTLPVGITTVNFSVTVTTIPTTNYITNAAKITYSFTVDPSIPNAISNSINTNITSTKINYTKITGIKNINTSYASTNDILIYTISLINNGIVDATNVVVSDTIPIGTSFVKNSITVNNISTSGTPSNINVGTISAGSISTITFKVKIES